MKLIPNAGNDRVIDLVQEVLAPGHRLDMVTPAISLFAFEALAAHLANLHSARLVLPPASADLEWLGKAADRPARNRLQVQRLASRLAEWLREKAVIRRATRSVPQGTLVVRDGDGGVLNVVQGSFALTTDGLGITPGNPLSFIQASEAPADGNMLSQWFDVQWAALSDDAAAAGL